jgi:hypothetical protein
VAVLDLVTHWSNALFPIVLTPQKGCPGKKKTDAVSYIICQKVCIESLKTNLSGITSDYSLELETVQQIYGHRMNAEH